ncbi:GDSL-like Lipase/Acylhydrolase family protein [Chitinophaga sp. CF118]|uniref:SGNH/GDSL hydrolase family protein n=1 Tax=Chitinophaga sp. CF118 TaxID=1884367 RepID=UPI0008F44ACA|nr:SGNH/GDSL hydrolase family protein [Chitinophaga sp. CF118]SFE60261.1 GDSL-like Lipase/Acylhydrolase family protein [Chitinophaga sp. CF118]
MKKTFSVLVFSIFVFLGCSKVGVGDERKMRDEWKKIAEVPDTSVFEGKNLATFGNSITAAENSWAYQLFNELKFKNLYNGAIGGSIWSKRKRTTASGKTIRTQNYNDPDFAGISSSNAANPDDLEYQKRINNCAIVHIQKYLSDTTAPTPDFIILSYGTNDLSSAAVLGDTAAVLREENLDSLDLNTIAGAVKWCIKTLKTKFPDAKLYVSLPLQAESVNRNKDNLKKIGIIKKICDGTLVPYFDCYAESGITQENSKQYLRDGLHPNESGKKVHGDYIIKKLKEANE